MRLSAGGKAFNALNVALMVVLSFLFLYPFWYVLALSLHDANAVSFYRVTFFPLSFTLQNYRVIFLNDMMVRGFMISVLRTALGASSSVLLSAMMAYALSKKNLVFRGFFMNLVIVTMFFGGGLIPTYILYRNINLLNKFWIYILPGLYGAWNLIIMKTFFQGLPASIEESAKIDGANDFVVLFRLVLPMSMALIATMLLFSGVAHWNDWVTGKMFVTDSNLHPMQTILMRILTTMEGQRAARESITAMELKRQPSLETVKMAAIVVSTTPILLSYPFLQKYFIKGILIGSIKE